MKAENAFEVELEHKLSKKEFEEALQILQKPENIAKIESNIWNIINTVCLTIKHKELLGNEDDLQQCKDILLFLVHHGKPKEVIVALMEEADSFKSHAYFCLLLDPLQHTLMREPGRRGKSLEWVLSTLNAHVQTLPRPEDLDLQGKEKLLLDIDPAVTDTNYVLAAYWRFLSAFVEEVSLRKTSNRLEDRVMQQRKILQKFILILFEHPFLFQDLSATEPKSTIRKVCEDYIEGLSKICTNVFHLYRMDGIEVDVDSEDCDRVGSISFSTLSYLIFVEWLTTDFQPFVFSHLYVFTQHLKHILPLLFKKENLVLFKGLHLAKALLDPLQELEIPHQYLEIRDFNELARLLLNVAIYSKVEVHRKMAIKVFLLYVSKSDWKGRYHLLIQTLDTVNHSGAEALAIGTYKTYIHECLTSKVEDVTLLGQNLRLFLKKVFVLKDGVETDILENSDRLLAAANLVRYLLLRDKREQNVTGTWDLVDFILDQFINPLATGLELSRAHYKQVAKDHEVDHKNKKKELKISVSIENKQPSKMPYAFEKEVFDRALLTFDLIELTLARVRELL